MNHGRVCNIRLIKHAGMTLNPNATPFVPRASGVQQFAEGLTADEFQLINVPDEVSWQLGWGPPARTLAMPAWGPHGAESASGLEHELQCNAGPPWRRAAAQVLALVFANLDSVTDLMACAATSKRLATAVAAAPCVLQLPAQLQSKLEGINQQHLLPRLVDTALKRFPGASSGSLHAPLR